METRILIYAPTGQDGALTLKILESASIKGVACHSAACLLEEMTRGVGAVLIVEEMLAGAAINPFAGFVAAQPTWSDLPFLVLTLSGADSVVVQNAVEKLGNVTLLERPVRTTALLSAARSALRARQRQYQVCDADKRKDEFLASLGHELRNPLAPISSSMGVLKHLYPDSPQVGKIVDTVGRQTVHLTRLVDDLLDAARITSGKVVLQRKHILLSDVVKHAVEICSSFVEGRQHDIAVIQPAVPVTLYADHARVVQSLANILANAAKFTPKPGTIYFHVKVVGNEAMFSIKDQGIGLEKASLNRIFEMFAQTAPADGQAPSGLGIGLSLAKKFTEMHEGSIHAKSEGLGTGCEFIITLPVVVENSTAHPASPAIHGGECPDGIAGSKRVLVVDDNRDAADMLHALLLINNFAATTAYDGQQAIRAVRESMPDIIVMDIGLPGMNGYEAARAIRQLPGGNNVQLIALTGWGQVSDKQLAFAAGFNHHFVKPIDFDALKTCL